MAVPRWAYFLTAIMFSINLLFIGFGLVDISSSPLSNKSLSTLNNDIGEYEGSDSLNTKTKMSSEANVGEGDSGEIKFGIRDIVTIGKNFINLILSLMFGYTVIFTMLNMPPILIYLFSTIIGIAMTMVVLDIIYMVLTAVRGLRL